MKRLIYLLALGLLIMAETALAAGEVQLDVKEKTLSNGMRILVVENHIAPVISTYIRFRVGAVDEHNGITGISHFLEHMLFKGTKIFGTSNYEAEVPLMKKIDSLGALLEMEKGIFRNLLRGGSEDRVKALRAEIAAVQAEQAKYIIKDELWETYLKNGGNGLNASTGNGGTQYYLSLPANRLELWAFMEADRMANLVFREFYSERDVIREERRLTTENQPNRFLSEALGATAMWASPYHWSVVGWATDIENYRLQDMEEYFHTYYHPSNAIAVVVGDVKPEEVFTLCEKYFGAIPARPAPRQVFTDDAPQQGERRVEVEYDAKPSAMIGWHMPQIGHPDVAALDVLSDILSKGRTSRLYKNIMEKKLGRASAGVSFSRYPELFTSNITPMGQHSVEEVIDATLAEIDRLKTEPVQPWEIERVRAQYDADFVRNLTSSIGMAFRIGDMEAMAGDWHYLIDYRDEYKRVTPEDIMRVANKYFTKSNRTIATLVNTGAKPAGGPGRPGGPGGPGGRPGM
ncbi:MAG: pitrilysin family protein [candidate division Zixibacteria bacterium]|nr:pitrilysin family protein [candidate division Zixibacteria bacterium]